MFQSLNRLFRNRFHLFFNSIRTEAILKTRMLSRLGSIKLKQTMNSLILKKLKVSLNLIDLKVKPRIEIWEDEETESVFHDPNFEEEPKLSVYKIVENFLEQQKHNLTGTKGKELIQILNQFLEKKSKTISVSISKKIPAPPPLKKKIPAPPSLKKKIPPPPPSRKSKKGILFSNFLKTRTRFQRIQ